MAVAERPTRTFSALRDSLRRVDAPVGRHAKGTPEGLVQAWQKRVSAGITPIPSVEVKDGPIFENVKRGGEVDMTIFPAPKWHEDDGGRYIGTGSFDITRDRDNGWVNL